LFFYGLIILFPLLFIVAGICLLAGMKTTGGAVVAAIILLLYPLLYIICIVVVSGAAFSTLQAGAYLMLGAGILAIIGAAANSGD
jgi:hypothetical protein